jgi:hypothetical protein
VDGPRLRVALILLLVAVLVGQFVWFGADPPAGPQHLSASTLHESYDSHVGQRVAVTAPVVATDPVVVGLDDGPDARLTVRNVNGEVSVGDRLKLYGVVAPGHEMRALGAVAVPGWGLRYTYAVSLVAGLWVLFRIVRHWRFDPGTLALERRDRPLW